MCKNETIIITFQASIDFIAVKYIAGSLESAYSLN